MRFLPEADRDYVYPLVNSQFPNWKIAGLIVNLSLKHGDFPQQICEFTREQYKVHMLVIFVLEITMFNSKLA